ncbi:MAG: heterodisulfide reductase-related iron-sulfur binding cluster [Myxococcales bacterium]|nr:heterodisulfide reductase-related iron-sulfur binding cluster [Myxococcota bacterium]MDW8281575.1 heterodisulfide reductase-related iron-sulfur binding cluster [Myxococcales bacterium]
MSETRISYQPTEGLCYDTADPRYWREDLLAGEIRRAFEICHGCRLCFKYCDAFPTLFGMLDERYDGDVRRLTPEDTRQVMDACFQCKQCELQCPYTPREQHEYQLDLPKLIHRYHAQRRRREPPTLRDRFLGNPDASAALARLGLGALNVLNRLSPHRWLMERVLGVHRDKLLPPFAQFTFDGWAEREGRLRDSTAVEAVLFPTCYVQHNEPQIGKDTLAVLDRNGVEVACVKGLRCCGMPAWERGDLEALRAAARHNLDLLEPYVAAGARVLAINPTCSMMMRMEYPTLVAEEDRPRAAKLAAAVRDPGEHLWSIRKETRFCTDFRSTPGAIAYHAPCHLRVQAIGLKGRDLLRSIPGVRIRTVAECSGHNGTYAMTVEGFGPSQRIGQRAFSAMQQEGEEVWATECPLAALQFAQHAGVRPLHPMTILARAYREDGFPTKLPRTAASEEP